MPSSAPVLILRPGKIGVITIHDLIFVGLEVEMANDFYRFNLNKTPEQVFNRTKHYPCISD